MTYQHENPFRVDDGDDLPKITPELIASDQVTEACIALDRHPNTFVRWPFPELDALTGPMAPGNVWFVCAASGGGKTTFVASVIDLWREAGKRVYVMPLETRPQEFRTYLACMALGVHPGDALSGQLRMLPDGEAKRLALKSELRLQGISPYVDRVMLSSQRAINIGGLTQGLKEAKAFGADVVIVDHIDHIAGGNGSNLYAEAKAVNDGALRMAQDNDLLLLFTSQLNMSASKGDYLAKYLPPRTEHVAFGTLKQRNATGMIGLFRPLRKRRSDELEDDYVKALRSARSGSGTVSDMLEPNAMGVIAMKLRNYGAREGMKSYLTVQHGRVFGMDEKDKYTTGGGLIRQVI
ncbi:MAG TPA: DnaB-like helicase C-terminal domain-containing protein [Polyangia bacterium]|nr:DnaB-like helicase C-terminal domain-containing protein [Polyangia bacterium]